MDFIQPEEDPTSHHVEGELCSCRCCEDLVQLELEAQKSLEEFTRRRIKLKSEKNMTHSLINKGIPPEVLSRIFTFCLPTHRELQYRLEYDYDVDFRPVEFGHVCRHWRDVAWSTPRLWQRLFVVLHSSQFKDLRASVLADLAREWLDRSGALPLTLYIQMDTNDPYYKEPHRTGHKDHPLLQVIKRYSQRWQGLYLRMWSPCITQLGLNVTTVTTIPLIRTLKHWPIGPLADPGTWWDIAMTPQHLDLSGLPASSPETISRFFKNIDWCHLNEVMIGSLPWNRYIQILESASQMTRFTISEHSSIPLGFREPFLRATEIVHSNLRYFSISARRIKFLNDFLSVLNFPSLTALNYNVGRSSRPSNISQCHYPNIFFDRIQNLKSLSIELSLSLESERYIDILKRWTFLDELFIFDRDKFYENSSLTQTRNYGRNLSNDGEPPCPLLSLLAATHLNDATTDSSNTFLPALQKLGYRSVFDDPPWNAILAALGPLSDFSDPRRRPLRALTIDFGYSAGLIDYPLARRLWEAKEAGVDITLIDDDWYHELEEVNDVIKDVVKKIEHDVASRPEGQ